MKLGRREVLMAYDTATGELRAFDRAADAGATTDGQASAAEESLALLQGALRTAEQVRAIGERLEMDPERTLAALASLAEHTPAQAEDPAGALSAHDEFVLRRAGSLREAMPALQDRASTRTALAAVRLLADALTVREAASRLGVTDSRVRQRLAARTLLGVEDSSAWRLPQFQFDGSGLLHGLDAVLPAFPEDAHPLAVLRLLESPHPDLELDGEPVSPREWLRLGGRPEPVVELVAGAYALP
ncbi:MAG TPA: hypothetical protein VFR07_09700 [Mycobacteriales bacterium]|nr:hypothetical protein [Mycobacteriales bacterium]